MKGLQKFLSDNYSLAVSECELILSFHSMMHLSKGDFFIEEGRICRQSGFLLDGLMRYFAYDDHGNDNTCYFSYPFHYIINPFTFDEQKVSGFNAQAITSCRLVVMSYDKDRELRKIFPKWDQVSRKIILDIAQEFSNQKSLLSLSASDRYASFLKTYPQVAQRAPLHYIATYLGIAQPSLSRIRKEFAVKS